MPVDISIKWNWEDVQALHPEWTKEECIDAIEDVESYVYERVKELGNDVLKQLLYEIVETNWGEDGE